MVIKALLKLVAAQGLWTALVGVFLTESKHVGLYNKEAKKRQSSCHFNVAPLCSAYLGY